MQLDNVRPPLKWVGGKYNQPEVWQRLVDLYKPFRDTHTWVEPFCGGLGATLRVQPDRALLADSNLDLIRFYCWYSPHNEFPDLPGAVTAENFSELRKQFNQLRDPSLFYWLNQACFQGVYRVNSRNEFNTPMGRDSSKNPYTVKFPTAEDRQAFSEVSKFWRFESENYAHTLEKSIELLRWEKFIYCDPPYDDGFSSYTAKGFNWQDQINLAKLIAGGVSSAVISNKATPRIIELYTQLGFDLTFIDCRRSVSCNGDRKTAREVLATINMNF